MDFPTSNIYTGLIFCGSLIYPHQFSARHLNLSIHFIPSDSADVVGGKTWFITRVVFHVPNQGVSKWPTSITSILWKSPETIWNSKQIIHHSNAQTPQVLVVTSPLMLKNLHVCWSGPNRNRWFTVLKKMVIFHGYVSHNQMIYNFFMVGEVKNPHGDHSGLIPGLRDTEAALHHGRSGSRGLRRIKELGIWAEHRKGTNRWTNYIYIYHIISLFHSSESSSIWSMEYLCPFNSHKNEYEMHHFEICGSPFEKTQP